MYIYTYITNTYIHLARLDVYIYIYTYHIDINIDMTKMSLVWHLLRINNKDTIHFLFPGIFGRQTLTFSGGFIPGIHQYSAEAFVPQLQMSGEPTSGIGGESPSLWDWS